MVRFAGGGKCFTDAGGIWSDERGGGLSETLV